MKNSRVSTKICSFAVLMGAGGFGPACGAGTRNSAPQEQAHPQSALVTDSASEQSPATPTTPTNNESFHGTLANTDSVAAPPQSTLPLPEGTKILHVGDSFAGALGLPLSKDLEAAGVRSILKHTDSSYLTTWAWEKDLQDYLWKYNPDLVMVTLGANELAIADPEQRERTVKKIVSTIGDRPCVWVAIPLWNGKQNGLMDVIERSVSPCVFMDTNKLIDVAKMPRISDGIHPTAQARVEWADFVFHWLKDHRVGGDKPWTLRP